MALEAERDSLKADLVQLRKERVEKAMEALSPKQANVTPPGNGFGSGVYVVLLGFWILSFFSRWVPGER